MTHVCVLCREEVTDFTECCVAMHLWHADCMREYITSQVSTPDAVPMFPFACPGHTRDDPCDDPLGIAELLAYCKAPEFEWIEQQVLVAYHRYLNMHHAPIQETHVYCAECDDVQVLLRSNPAYSVPRTIACSMCSKVQCTGCSLPVTANPDDPVWQLHWGRGEMTDGPCYRARLHAHFDMHASESVALPDNLTVAQYAERVQQYIHQRLPHCPTCGHQVVKSNGCNEMTCEYCPHSTLRFCFVCNGILFTRIGAYRRAARYHPHRAAFMCHDNLVALPVWSAEEEARYLQHFRKATRHQSVEHRAHANVVLEDSESDSEDEDINADGEDNGRAPASSRFLPNAEHFMNALGDQHARETTVEQREKHTHRVGAPETACYNETIKVVEGRLCPRFLRDLFNSKTPTEWQSRNAEMVQWYKDEAKAVQSETNSGEFTGCGQDVEERVYVEVHMRYLTIRALRTCIASPMHELAATRLAIAPDKLLHQVLQHLGLRALSYIQRHMQLPVPVRVPRKRKSVSPAYRIQTRSLSRRRVRARRLPRPSVSTN